MRVAQMPTLIYRVLAIALLLAAALKAYAIFSGLHVQDGWSNDPKFRMLAIEWEALLGFWLLFGRAGAVRWTAAFLTFVSFAVVSGVLGVTGAASCGCLGIIHVNPWWMFMFDLAAMAVLLSLRPLWLDFKQRRYAMLAGALAAIAFTGMAVANIGAPKDLALLELREIGIAMPREVSVGAGHAGEWREASLEIANHGSEPVRVYGGSYGCGLDLLSDCPAVVLPGAATKLRVRLRLPKDIGEYAFNGSFFISNEAGSTAWDVPVTVNGVTLGNPD